MLHFHIVVQCSDKQELVMLPRSERQPMRSLEMRGFLWWQDHFFVEAIFGPWRECLFMFEQLGLWNEFPHDKDWNCSLSGLHAVTFSHCRMVWWFSHCYRGEIICRASTSLAVIVMNIVWLPFWSAFFFMSNYEHILQLETKPFLWWYLLC